ncbi:FUSC family protein [Alloacidobacterium dinghuense]|uniref:FUSC family protein n=1 Tax=Alloacidobacterium dinghuense TaxID=2763107 RepID=A0A7G8BLM2_9BACT|nr:FUSC family protein [Alloacidobacterium dinghuense]QNI33442.1 FUSC family protein [Alloacidobacterium dinghuense]
MPLSATQSKTRSWLQYLTQDLQPTPGRLDGSLRITLTSVLVLITMMVLQMPFVAYALYVIFMVGRDSPAVTLRTGFALLCAVSCALAISLVVVILTDNNPMARVLSLATITFVAGMITVATSMPSLGSGWGIIFSVGISFWENHTRADTLVKNSLWLLAAFATGIAVAIAVEYLLATRSPVDKLSEQLGIRYRALETMFKAYASNSSEQQRRSAAEHVSRLAGAGHAGMFQLYSQLADRDLNRGSLPMGVHAHITMLAELLDSSAAFGLQIDVVDIEIRSRCEVIARQCSELASKFRTDPALNLNLRNSTAFAHLERVEIIIQSIGTMSSAADEMRPNLVALPSKQVPLLISGAISKRENVAFALKVSLCATICYILYHAIDWPGISTCVITVMVAGLSHSGAMKQKLALRLLGATIGGLVLGIGAEVFLFPFMDSITALVVVIGAIAFLCAWVAGGPRFNYVGLQMAFAFYLTSLEGFSAPTELSPARDRFVGILLGVVVMWFVLDQIWPVRTVTVMRRVVVSVLKDASRVVALMDDKLSLPDYMRESDVLRDRLGKQLSTVRMLNEATQYELGVEHEKHMRMGDTFMRMSMTTVALIWNQASLLHKEAQSEFLTQPALIRLRQTIAERLSAMADALEEHDCLPTGDAAGPLDVALSAGDVDSEYSRNTIARYNELHAVALSLDPTG